MVRQITAGTGSFRHTWHVGYFLPVGYVGPVRDFNKLDPLDAWETSEHVEGQFKNGHGEARQIAQIERRQGVSVLID